MSLSSLNSKFTHFSLGNVYEGVHTHLFIVFRIQAERSISSEFTFIANDFFFIISRESNCLRWLGIRNAVKFIKRISVYNYTAFKAVSYTHLDVYKRQVLRNLKCFGTGNKSVKVVVKHELF